MDWSPVRLIVFDVDGTLYDQKPLRFAMLRMLLRDAAATRSLRTFRVLADYRRERERLADAGVEDFDAPLIDGVARRAGLAAAEVARLVETWIERRPLPLLRRHRVAGADTLFEAIRGGGRALGVLSDYPARAKLDALGLRADHVVAAGDAGVGIMKPDPRGLCAVIAAAGVTAAETVLIGDRVERDGAAARAAGAGALIRARTPLPGWTVFRDFDDPVFAPLRVRA